MPHIVLSQTGSRKVPKWRRDGQRDQRHQLFAIVRNHIIA
jgi:hypothetical protein